MIDSFSCIHFHHQHSILTYKSRSYMLKSAILKADVVCDIAMMSTANVLMTELRDILYNQCIDNTLLFIFSSSEPLGSFGELIV